MKRIKQSICALLALTTLFSTAYAKNLSVFEDVLSQEDKETEDYIEAVGIDTYLQELDTEAYYESNFVDSWDDLSILTGLDDTPSYTQVDLKNNFSNYATEDSTVNFSTVAKKNVPTANVVGIVLDFYSDEPISGAEVFVNDEPLVIVGDDGRFQVYGMPDGIYDFMVIADDYKDSMFYNYSIDAFEDTVIFTFYMRNDESFITNSEDFRHQDERLLEETQVEFTTNAMRASTTVPHCDNNVYVEINGVKKKVTRQNYLTTVVSSEMDSVRTLYNKGMSDKEILQLYTAQAMTASTYLEYCKNVYSNHRSTGSDLCNKSHCQAYDTTKTNSVAATAVSNIFNTVGGKKTCVVFFYKPSTTYNYFYAAYFSDCDNQGTKNYAGQPALRQVACTDLYNGYNGHRNGLCQTGAAMRATEKYNAVEICQYYYTDVKSAFCIIDNL